MTDTQAPRRNGFTRAATLVQPRIRTATESRGFAVSRVLTHWEEIVGPELAALCRPVQVGYAKGGLGATLTVLTTGARAPQVDMARSRIIDRVNAAHGHRAISHVRITQTSATGFAEPAAAFAPAPAGPAPAARAAAEAATADVQDTELRLALAALAANVLDRRNR